MDCAEYVTRKKNVQTGCALVENHLLVENQKTSINYL